MTSESIPKSRRLKYELVVTWNESWNGLRVVLTATLKEFRRWQRLTGRP